MPAVLSGFFLLIGLLFVGNAVFHLARPNMPMRGRYGGYIRNRGLIVFVSMVWLITGLFILGMGAQFIYGDMNKIPGVANGCVEQTENVDPGRDSSSDYHTSCGTFHLDEAMTLTPGATYNFQYERIPSLFPWVPVRNDLTRIDRINP